MADATLPNINFKLPVMVPPEHILYVYNPGMEEGLEVVPVTFTLGFDESELRNKAGIYEDCIYFYADPKDVEDDPADENSPNHSEYEVSNNDAVNHPSHYNQYNGLEIIDLVEQMNFNRGNAVKYIARAGFKSPEKELEDLEKAAWYLNREIERVKSATT